MIGLLIKGKIFSGKFDLSQLNEMITQLRSLPCPSVMPLGDSDVTEEETALCLQREMLHVDVTNPLHPLNSKRFIGTKFVSTCIVACIYNDTNTFLIHVDSTEINLAPELKKFTSTANLKVILIGAGDTNKKSQINVNSILLMLHKAASDLNLLIEITEQCVLERNAFKPEDSFRYLHDRIIAASTTLARKYFKTKFDLSRFPAKDKIIAFKKDAPKDGLLNPALIKLIPFVCDLHPKENLPIKNLCDLLFSKSILTLEDFYKSVDAIFSIQGYNILNSFMLERDGYVSYSLTNFVFNLDTKRVTVIPAAFTTPNELQRVIAVNREACTNTSYHYAFDNLSHQYRRPKFRVEFILNCLVIKEKALDCSITAQDFCAALYMPFDLTHVPIIYEFVTTLPHPESPPACLTLFASQHQENLYQNDQLYSCDSLDDLNKITEKTFSLQMRKYPKCVLDALLICTSKDEAHKLKAKLSDKGINSYILNPATLCVGAINTSSVRMKISDALNVDKVERVAPKF